MATFGNKVETIQDLELQKKQLTEEVVFLGQKIEEAQAELAQFDIDSKAVAEVQEKLEQASLTLEKIETEITAKTKEAAEIGVAISGMEDHRDKLSAVIERLQKDVNEIETASKLALDKLEAEVNEKKQKLTAVNEELVSLEEQLSELVNQIRGNTERLEEQEKQKDTQEAQIEFLTAEIEDLNASLSGLTDEIRGKQAYAAELASKCEVAGNELIKSSGEAAEILKAANDYKTKIEAELAEREGEISRREEILAEKTTRLRDQKQKLETHFNKTINLVI